MAKHAFKVGDLVTVMNQSISGKQIIEGRAKVRRLLDQDDTYMVSFGGERSQYERRVTA